MKASQDNSQSYKAYRVYQVGERVEGRLEAVTLPALAPGEVGVQVHYSSINFKDALGASGRGKIYKKFPITAGIDAAGVVAASADSRFQPGMEVLVTGCGFGESHDGGYTEYSQVPADWLLPLPAGLSLYEAMALGTAGFTSALCIQRLEDNGQTPAKGPFVVTGASGGVGSLAICMLARLGYEVVAVSGKAELKPYLLGLGASRVLSPEEVLREELRLLGSVAWGGAIDNVGGRILAALLARTQLWGNVASVGLAESAELHSSVMPFILRGVSLLGISSANCPYPLRQKLWQRLGGELKPAKLSEIAQHEVSLSELSRSFDAFLERRVVGRYVVNCRR